MPHSGFVKQHQSAFTFVQQVIDLALVWSCFPFAVWLMDVEWSRSYSIANISSTLMYFLFAQQGNLYQSWRGQSLLAEMRQVCIAWVSMLLIALFAAYVLKTSEDFSRRAVVTWLVLTPVLLCVFRLGLRLFLRHARSSGRNFRRIAIAGTGPAAIAIARNIAVNPWMGMQLQGFYDDSEAVHSRPVQDIDAEVCGNLPLLISNAKDGQFDEIFIALPMRAEMESKLLVQALADTSTQVQYVPDIFTFNLINSRVRDIGGIPVISVYDSPLDSIGRLMKRVEDVVISLLILLLIAVPMAMIALAVKLHSPGPVLFRQRRYGLNGDEFLVWKFRSMTVCEDGGIVQQATRDDVRITRLGSFLRKTSLDELPQFFNVLQGTMSIVGPRPHAIAHNEMYRKEIEGYMQRHLVKPGITGWAQINGWRGETDTTEKMQKRVEYDMHYIRNWSVWFDLKIILLTVMRGFIGRNAY
jgi:putative colanic acid biosysnthesis UDP-glucose lipid carrier transferase